MIPVSKRGFFTYLADIRNKDRRWHYLDEVQRECEYSRDQILSRQWERVTDILYFAYNNVPFYKERFDCAGLNPKAIQDPSDLVKIPILEREDLIRNQKELMNINIKGSEIIETATGGTTSSPVRLWLDRECLSRRRAATLYFYRWIGYRVGESVAMLWGAAQDFPSKRSFKSRLREFLTGPILWLYSVYLNDDILWEYYEKLKNFKPDILQAYPTPLHIFSCFLEQNKLKLSINKIHVASEYLYDYQREKIESVFSTQIFNWYGARELGHMATECNQHRGMHINCYGLYIEVIKDGNQVEGDTGELIITDLFNKAMPLIRYKIGDIGKISHRNCPCGHEIPLIEDVGGRYVDTFKKGDGSFIPGVSFTNRIIKDHRGIKKLQIVQKDYEKFELNIVKGAHYENEELEALKKRIRLFMREKIEFDINFVDDIKPEKSGKLIFCKSEIDV